MNPIDYRRQMRRRAAWRFACLSLCLLYSRLAWAHHMRRSTAAMMLAIWLGGRLYDAMIDLAAS